MNTTLGITLAHGLAKREFRDAGAIRTIKERLKGSFLAFEQIGKTDGKEKKAQSDAIVVTRNEAQLSIYHIAVSAADPWRVMCEGLLQFHVHYLARLYQITSTQTIFDALRADGGFSENLSRIPSGRTPFGHRSI